MFGQMFPVSKDLRAMRKKGVMQEEIVEAIQEQHSVTEVVARKSHTGYPRCAEYVMSNKEGTVGIYAFYCGMGIPTYKVGVQDEQAWKEIRQNLREGKLVR